MRSLIMQNISLFLMGLLVQILPLDQ
uniref:Casein kinase I isogeny 2 n=1 Tax=Rhizophora mucronata TaxID=61149 RepID=A0A2P2LHP4_RHIMU